MNSFLIALQFLTILPVTHTFIASDKQLGYSALFYPVVGLLIGGLLAFSSIWLSNLSVSVQSALILIFWVFLTGGLHLDGLADCADAWVGGLGSKQRSLDIMKDPAAGPVAVVVLVLLLLLKWSIICIILDNESTDVLLLTPMLGRLAILMLMLSTAYIRPEGLGEKIVKNMPVLAVRWLTLLCLLTGIYFLGVLPISFVIIMLITISYQSKKRLGGVTGDVYGASVELAEISLLLGFIL